MARVLVLDGHSAASLAFTRSLGRAGHWVAVGSAKGIFAAAALSRYCRARFEHSSSTENATAFASEVLEYSKANGVELIVPVTDWTSVPMSRHREEFAKICRVALPSPAALDLASDKYATIRLAESLQVPIPQTFLIQSLGNLDTLGKIAYPAVVKDRASARWIGERAVSGTVAYAYSESDLRTRVEQRLGEAGDVLIQKFTPGVGIGYSCFAIDGKIYLPFQWERIREVDPKGSGSSARKSVPLEPKVVEFSEKLILAAGFQGIAMVEFKKDATGNPILMEINGRPWGSIQLAIASGVDYPRHLLDWCLEGKLPPREIAYKQIVCRRMVGELTHLENLRRGKNPLWPLPYPNFWSTLVKVAIPWYPGMRYDDLSLTDPRPGFAGLWDWAQRRIGR